ncbi:MAG: geranylgeranyl reductase family protein [Bacteroidota bacterium]
MKNEYDLIIVGAGPAGATCALTLIENTDLRIAIVDKASFPRDKICGDALSGKVVSVLKYAAPQAEAALHNLPPKLGSWGIRFFAPNGQCLDIPFKSSKQQQINAPGYISKRLDFDDFLLKQIRNQPHIDIREGFAVQSVETHANGVIVSDGTEALHAPLVLGADGAHSVITKSLSDIKVDKMHYSAGLRAYYEGVTGFQQENFIELHYIPELLPGYFWIFPLPNGWANVGLGMLSADVSKLKINLKEKLRQIIEENPVISKRFANAKLVDEVRGFGLPLGSKKRRISGDRFMLAGDAASLIDPFSGEGIGNAMLSGRIAAQTLLKCREVNDYSAAFLQQYDQAVYKKIWRELRLSYQLQKLVNYPWLFNFVVRKANSNPSVQKMFTMMFDDLDMRKELSKPGFYWRLVVG